MGGRSFYPGIPVFIRRFVLLLSAGLLFGSPGYCLPSLQLFIDLTAPGGTLRPLSGTYAGPIVINKPITLDGQGQVTIQGEGKGTVLTVLADNTTVRGLHITHSGESHDGMDTGVLLEADGGVIEGNVIDDTLFGIYIKQGRGNIIRGNRIASKSTVPSLRGDGIRLWYSTGNLIENNDISDVRDLLLTNSPDNRIVGNRMRDSRISLELIYSPDNEVEDNLFSANDTGIVAINSDGVSIRRNRIEHIGNVGSSALAIKESSQVVIAENEIVHNNTGLTANAPLYPENILYLLKNHFSYNNIALYFYGEKGGHIIRGNQFDNNLIPVAVSSAVSARYNDWQGNYWDQYEGFDLNGDGIGDTPFNLYLYSSRIWMDRPTTQFLRGSPLMALIDFVERLTPFSQPDLILSDTKPRLR
ncbi:MAG: nitrous oxide reductase family maturation protein NosD [Gammaproteobacteria bacterium]|nr:nitrous oxide reductase family maturation protein NosD [Gammaproteobacteria bacterium]